jgi:hypothetical protein
MRYSVSSTANGTQPMRSCPKKRMEQASSDQPQPKARLSATPKTTWATAFEAVPLIKPPAPLGVSDFAEVTARYLILGVQTGKGGVGACFKAFCIYPWYTLGVPADRAHPCSRTA